MKRLQLQANPVCHRPEKSGTQDWHAARRAGNRRGRCQQRHHQAPAAGMPMFRAEHEPVPGSRLGVIVFGLPTGCMGSRVRWARTRVQTGSHCLNPSFEPIEFACRGDTIVRASPKREREAVLPRLRFGLVSNSSQPPCRFRLVAPQLISFPFCPSCPVAREDRGIRSFPEHLHCVEITVNGKIRARLSILDEGARPVFTGPWLPILGLQHWNG